MEQLLQKYVSLLIVTDQKLENKLNIKKLKNLCVVESWDLNIYARKWQDRDAPSRWMNSPLWSASFTSGMDTVSWPQSVF